MKSVRFNTPIGEVWVDHEGKVWHKLRSCDVALACPPAKLRDIVDEFEQYLTDLKDFYKVYRQEHGE